MFGFGALERRTPLRPKRNEKTSRRGGAGSASIITETARNFERFFEIFADFAVVENDENDGRLRGVGYKDSFNGTATRRQASFRNFEAREKEGRN